MDSLKVIKSRLNQIGLEKATDPGGIKILEEEERQLSVQMNELDPFSRLPNEVLSYIFLIGSTFDPTAWSRNRQHNSYPIYRARVAACCRRWRAVVLSTPRIWSNVGPITLRRCSNHLDLLPTLLAYSKSSPLDLEIVGVPGALSCTQPIFDSLLNIITPHLQRCFRMSALALSNTQVLALWPLSGMGSAFEELSVFMGPDGTNEDSESEHDLPDIKIPSPSRNRNIILRRLSLLIGKWRPLYDIGMLFLPVHPVHYRRLRYLCIGAPIFEFYTVLKECSPTLEHLIWRSPIPLQFSYQVPIIDIELGRLKTLVVVGTYALRRLRNLKAPELEALEIMKCHPHELSTSSNPHSLIQSPSRFPKLRSFHLSSHLIGNIGGFIETLPLLEELILDQPVRPTFMALSAITPSPSSLSTPIHPEVSDMPCSNLRRIVIATPFTPRSPNNDIPTPWWNESTYWLTEGIPALRRALSLRPSLRFTIARTVVDKEAVEAVAKLFPNGRVDIQGFRRIRPLLTADILASV